MKRQISRLFTIAMGCQLMAATCLNAQTGTWTAVASQSPNPNMGVMVLMTDGTVLCHNATGGTYGTGWDKLTPNASGSYVNGTWTTVKSMNYDRLFFPTQVLPSGKLFAAGGEYGAGATRGEVYDPVANTWTNTGTVTGSQNIYDGNSQLLSDGNILVGVQNGNNPSFDNLYFDPTTNAWSTAPICVSPYNHDEAEWVKLPDYSILFVGIASTKSCRFEQSTATWITDGTLPDSIFDKYGEESGAGFMLPNGKAVFFGATGHNALYTPTGTITPGSWTTAAFFPKIQGTYTGQTDAAAAMMVNGHILCAVSPVGTSNNNEFNNPVYFVEYDYTTNTCVQVKSPIPTIGGDSIPGNSCYQMNMLDLPDGNVLVSIDQASYSNQYWIYTPGSAAIPQGKPTINSVYEPTCGNYYATGKLFNGISEGAAYGDDWQMSSNYPIIRLTNGTNVYYCKTTNWNRLGAVQTDSLEDTTQFTLPAGLPIGTYSLVVVVNGFASNPTLFTYTQFTATAVATANVTCNGQSNGNATVTTTGGFSPYTYNWSNGTSTVSTSNPTGPVLSAGSFTVTVTDPAGCSATAKVTITQPTAVAITIASHTNAGCSTLGSATANAATGGSSPYTYAWGPSGGTNLAANGLSAGTYTITATDKNGCTGSASVTITQSGAITVIAITTQNIKCNGGNTGSVSSTVSGGASPYTYLWTGGSTTSTETALSAGTYTITVTDHSGCTATAAAIITQPTLLAVSATVTANETCFGENIGKVSSTPTGGTSPYTYAWTGGSTTATESSLTAGTYTITVTDKNGCVATATATVTQPTQLTATINIIANAGCSGNAGNLTSTVGGGTSPYTYSWTGGNTNTAISNLSAGTYTLGVTDAHGCSATASASITQSAQLTLSDSVNSNVLCHGGISGSATVYPAGGTPPFTYAWTSGSTNATATGLSAGSYTVIVNDHGGCSGTASLTITQPSQLAVTATTTTNALCNGQSNGATSSTASGGVSPYTYAWTGGSTSSTASGLAAGTYVVTLTDANGCTATASTIVSQPIVLSITAGVTTNVLCHGESNGTASANPAGGTMPFTYSWAGGSTNSTATGLSAGTYTVNVTDNNGCTITATANVTQPVALSLTPGSQTTTTGNCLGKAWVGVTGGTVVYTYMWTPGLQTTDSIKNLCVGNYCCKVTDANGCVDSVCVDIVTGIEGIDNASSINIYPDPNNGDFTVTGLIRGQVVEIYNYLGQVISNVKADDATMHYNISDKANGVYLIRIRNNDGTVVIQQKMIKTQ